MIPDFIVSESIKIKLPETRLGLISCRVKVIATPPGLLAHIKNEIQQIQSRLKIEDVSQTGLIKQTKEAYRILGKDPSRYRPSAEALTRRIVQGKGLYQVNNLVDLLNLVSVMTGFSIGGYDEEMITGPSELDTGKENEPYQAIGRGDLNIHLLPVLRDQEGPFGSPTSDSRRTMVRDSTRQFLMVFFDFFSDKTLMPVLDMSAQWLNEWAGAEYCQIHRQNAT